MTGWTPDCLKVANTGKMIWGKGRLWGWGRLRGT